VGECIIIVIIISTITTNIIICRTLARPWRRGECDVLAGRGDLYEMGEPVCRRPGASTSVPADIG
jgi:hypothetical protein